MNKSVGALLLSGAMLILLGCLIYWPASAASKRLEIKGHSPSICQWSDPYSDPDGDLSVAGNIRHSEGISDVRSSRTLTIRFQKVMCNGAPRRIAVKSVNGGFVLARQSKVTDGNVQQSGKKKHYRLRGKLGEVTFPEMNTAAGQSTTEIVMVGPFLSSLVLEMDIREEHDSAPDGTYREHLEITMDPAL